MENKTNEKLCKLAQKGNTNALTYLIMKNTGFIKQTAIDLYMKMNLAEKGIDIDTDDLTQEGNIGLLRAIPLYDSNQNMKFLTYAAPAIRNAMMDLIRSGFSLYEQRMINGANGIRYQRIQLDNVLSEEERMQRIKAIADPNVKEPLRVLTAQETLQELYHGLTTITKREQTYLLYRFGFTDDYEHPLNGSAQYFHLSENRARKLESDAIEHLSLELPWWYS